MRIKLLKLLAVGAAMVIPSAVAAQVRANASAQAPVALGAIPNQYICVFKANVARANVRAEAQRSASAEAGQTEHVYENAVKGFSVRLPAAAIQRLRSRNPNIASCEQDQVVRALVQGKPGGVTQAAQSLPWGITRVNPGRATYTSNAIAWVIDSGIDLDHPDLNVDVQRSRSFVRGAKSADDGNGHGTHVAGTIAALDNSIGVVGVAPGAPVVAVRVLNAQGSGTNSGVIAGVDYVAANARPGDVANMSLGGGVSAALDAAVAAAAAKGIRFTLAAGNSAAHANTSSPARVNGPNIYTVSAFAQGDSWASFSNYGNPPVDLGEPGVSVLSTYKGGGYATLSGTSMAAPHLAGILLLGPVRTNGVVAGDPDGTPDPIGVH